MRADPRRLDEFARYHVDGDGECNGVVINGIADGRAMGLLERIELSYFYSVVYNVPSALFMYEQKDAIRDDPWGWAEKNRRNVMFTSDRHWVNISDRFERLLEQFGRAAEEFAATIGEKGAIDVASSVDAVMDWYYFSRFCAYMFVETAVRATGLQTENMPVFDVLHGDTATSGLMNIAGMDDEANEFDATSKVPSTCSVEALLGVMDSATSEIENRGGGRTSRKLRRACARTGSSIKAAGTTGSTWIGCWGSL